MNAYRSRSVKTCLLCPNRSNVTDTQTNDPLQRITYHKLPAGTDRRDRWLEFCGHTKESFASLGFKFVCSNHFEPNCFERDLRSELLDGIKRMVLRKDALPTIRTKEQQLTRRPDTPSNDEEERNKRKAEVEKLLTGETPAAAPIVNPFRKHICEERPKAKRKGSPLRHAGSTNGAQLVRVLSPLSETEMLQRIAQLERVTAEQNQLIQQLQRTIDQKTEKINFAKAEMVNIAISLQEIKDHANRHVSERVVQLLADRFSEGQLAAMGAGEPSATAGKEIPWTTDDLVKALELRCISMEAFRHVQQKWNYPLPDAPPIERWIHGAYLETGLNATAFRLLELHAASLAHTELICSLTISHTPSPIRYQYDRKRDQLIGPNAHLHCVTVQGIFSEWLQLVHVDFDLHYSHELLQGIIAKLHRMGYRVVAITTACDRHMATDVWNALGLCSEQHFVRHPITDNPVYLFVCPDGMLSGIHRILVDDGFVMQQNNVMISKDNVLATLDRLMASAEPRIVNTLTIDQRHINFENLTDCGQLSRELISHSTSHALKYAAAEADDDDTLSTLGTLFDIFIDWYELCTSAKSIPWTDQHPAQQCSITRLPYGTCEDEQNIILDAMFDVMENFRCTNADYNFVPEAVLISINSTRRLLVDLRRSYPGQISSVPMHRLGLAPLCATITNLRSSAFKDGSGTALTQGTELLWHLCQAVSSDTQEAHVSNRLLQLGQLSLKIPLEVLNGRPQEKIDSEVLGVTEQNACHYLTKLIATRLGLKYDYLGECIVKIERQNDRYVVKPEEGETAAESTLPSALWVEQAKILESCIAGKIQERTPALVTSLVNSIHNQHPRMGRDLVEMYVTERIALQLQLLNRKLTDPPE